MQKKTLLLISFALAAILVVGQVGFAAEPRGNNQGNGMMNGNGSGMMSMMQNENMNKMMGAMNSPEGQQMINSCGNFMDSYGSKKDDTSNGNPEKQNFKLQGYSL